MAPLRLKWHLTRTGRMRGGDQTTGRRFRAAAVYSRTVCDYVHLNPVRAKVIQSETALESFGWSSYGSYLGAPSQRPAWLRVDRLLGEHGIPKDSVAGRREFALQTEQRRRQETG